LEALKARNNRSRLKALRISLISFSSRAFSAGNLNGINLGRWPRLLHFAPLALKARSFLKVSEGTVNEIAGTGTSVSAQHSAPSRFVRYLDPFIFYALMIVIVLTAIPYGTVEPWWKAVFQCGIFALGLLWMVDGTLSGTLFVREHRLLIPLLALIVFLIIQIILPVRAGLPGSAIGAGSRPISFAPWDTKMAAFQLIALVVTAALLLRYTTTRRRLMTLVYVVVGVGVGSTLFGLLRRSFQHKVGFLLPQLQPADANALIGVGFAQFLNHNHFAFLVEMSLGLLLGLMLRRPLRPTRMVLGLVLALPLWIAIVYSGSRGGLASMIAQILFVALLVFIASPGRELLRTEEMRGQAGRIGPFLIPRVALITSFLIVMVMGIVWVGGDPLAYRLQAVPNEFGVKDSDKFTRSHRSTIWPMTWQMIKDHPLAGVGFGSYWIAITGYHQGSGELTPQEAHNDYLELLASGGLIGAVFVVWFVALFLNDLLTRSRHSPGVLGAYSGGALAGIFAVAIHSIVDFGLHVTINAVVFTTLIAIATVRIRSGGPESGMSVRA
jgi:O-antigen ligase